MFRENFETFYPVTVPAIRSKPEAENPSPKSAFAALLMRLCALLASRLRVGQSAGAGHRLDQLSDHLLRDIGMDRGDVAGTDIRRVRLTMALGQRHHVCRSLPGMDRPLHLQRPAWDYAQLHEGLEHAGSLSRERFNRDKVAVALALADDRAGKESA